MSEKLPEPVPPFVKLREPVPEPKRKLSPEKRRAAQAILDKIAGDVLRQKLDAEARESEERRADG